MFKMHRSKNGIKNIIKCFLIERKVNLSTTVLLHYQDKYLTLLAILAILHLIKEMVMIFLSDKDLLEFNYHKNLHA